MIRTGPYSYEISSAPPETVTITVTPYGTSARVRMALDGTALQPTEEHGKLLYSWPCSKPIGQQHAVTAAFEFSEPPSNTPQRDHYEISVSGSEGGDYDERPVLRNDHTLDRDFTFVVVESAKPESEVNL